MSTDATGCAASHRAIDNACGVDQHGRRIAGQQARTQHARGRRRGADAVQEREDQHPERGDHEVDARAGFLDQEQTLAREVPFSRLRHERWCRSIDAGQPRRRTRGSTPDPRPARPRSAASAPRRSAPPTASTHESQPHDDASRPPAPPRQHAGRRRSNTRTSRAHPHDAGFGTVASRRPRDRTRPPEAAAAGRRRRRPHWCADDLLHGDERRVPREQAIGQPQRRDRGDAILARRSRTEIRQVGDARSRPQIPKRAVAGVGARRRRRESSCWYGAAAGACPRSRSIQPRGRATCRRRRSGGWRTGPGRAPARRRRRRSR